MIMADVFTIVFIILGILLSLPAFWLVTRALFPEQEIRIGAKLRERPVASFFTGAGVGLGIIVVLLILGSAPVQPIKVLAFLGGCAAIGYGLMGAGAIATIIGNRLPSAADQDQPWRPTMRGGIALELSFLIPFLGWFLLLPGSILLGAGANTLAIFAARSRKPVHPEVASPVAAAQPTPMASVVQ